MLTYRYRLACPEKVIPDRVDPTNLDTERKESPQSWEVFGELLDDSEAYSTRYGL